jgi:hypothetical protein
MSEYVARPGDGGLFKNANATSDKHPSMTGYVIAHRDIKEGERLDLAAWTKEGKAGRFQSLKMQDAWKAPERDAPNDDLAPSPPDSEIPF